MRNMFRMLTAGLPPLDAVTIIVNVVDVLLVAALLYQLLMWARGTRAWQIMWGIVIYLLVLWLSTVLDLSTLAWILQKFEVLGPVAIVILFFPELRHVLEEMGRIGFWGSRFRVLDKKDVTRTVDEIVRAAVDLSASKTGALIVIERETGLNDYVATGRTLDATLSADLLGTIFYPGGPMHDGAVIVRGDKAVAAGCVLPLTSHPGVGTSIHTRHRAAMGITEQSDALVVVVSEETGSISLAHDGRLIRGLKEDGLRDRLISLLEGTGPRAEPGKSPVVRPAEGG
jgi:diadenylate cyclase